MKKYFPIFFYFLCPLFLFSQVGIGTTNPQGQLDIASDNMALILPRVSKIENVTDGSGNVAPNGAVVYDLSRKETCFRMNDKWVCFDVNDNGDISISVQDPYETSTYIKSSNTGSNDQFGYSVSLSGDGDRLAVGAYNEDSNATGIDGNQSDNSANNSGAVYVFYRSNGVWAQEAYIKASNTAASDFFGYSVSLSDDGIQLAVGAYGEDSNAIGIGGDQMNNSASISGAAYIFTRSSGSWVQEAYIKASNTDADDRFGCSVSLSGDGTQLAVGAFFENSNATGIDGNQSNNSPSNAGAVYAFIKSGGTWSQEAYIKASNTEVNDEFGYSVSFSDDGTYLAVGAHRESSNAVGINGDQANNSAGNSGAVYAFSRNGGSWSQDAYIKASNSDGGDYFGTSISLSSDGSKLAVGADGESSTATGIDGVQGNGTGNSGAVYLFSRTGTAWLQETYIKASNTDPEDHFGISVSLSNDATRLAVGAYWESSSATGLDGDQTNNSSTRSGAVYAFSKNGSAWEQDTYIKSSNTDDHDYFGNSVSISGNGTRAAIAAYGEDSNATGVGGDQTNNATSGSGAVYIID